MKNPDTMRTEPKLGGFFVLGAGEVLTRGLTFLAFAYLGRVLEPTHFGLLGSAFAALMFCTLAVDQGFGVLGSRAIARDLEVTESLVRRIVAAQLNLAIGVLIALITVTWALPLDPTFARLLRRLGIALLGFPFLINWVFQGRNEMFWFAAPAALRQGIFLVGAILWVRGPDDLLRLPVAEIAAIAGAGFFFVAVYRRRLGYPFHIDLRAGWDRKLFADALPIGISNLIWAARMYVPILVVLAALGSEPAGFFEAGHRLTMAVLSLLSVYFTNIFPAMSATAHASRRDFEALIRRALLTSVGAMAVVFVVTLALAPWILGIVFGDSYVTAASVRTLVVLIAIAPIMAWRRTARFALIVLERQRAELICSIIGVALLLSLLWPLTLYAGIAGSAWAMVISELAGTLLTWLMLRWHLRGTTVASV